jgi:hypothetical protein
MTPERFRECLHIMGLGPNALAYMLGLGDNRLHIARRWASGRVNIPTEIAEWVEKLVLFFEANPPPRRWQPTKADFGDARMYVWNKDIFVCSVASSIREAKELANADWGNDLSLGEPTQVMSIPCAVTVGDDERDEG